MPLTVYTLGFFAHLAIAGAVVAGIGSDRDRFLWFGFFCYTAIVYTVLSGRPDSLFYYGLLNAIMAWMLYRYSPTVFGDMISLGFALMLVFGGFAGVMAEFGNTTFVERGRGITAPTFWNANTIMMHLGLLSLEAHCVARMAGLSR